LAQVRSDSGGLKTNEIAKFGHYRTKRLVLAEFDRMFHAGSSMSEVGCTDVRLAARISRPLNGTGC
jgi:hypothetical protein